VFVEFEEEAGLDETKRSALELNELERIFVAVET